MIIKICLNTFWINIKNIENVCTFKTRVISARFNLQKIVSSDQFKVFKLKHNNYLSKCNALNILNKVSNKTEILQLLFIKRKY